MSGTENSGDTSDTQPTVADNDNQQTNPGDAASGQTAPNPQTGTPSAPTTGTDSFFDTTLTNFSSFRENNALGENASSSGSEGVQEEINQMFNNEILPTLPQGGFQSIQDSETPVNPPRNETAAAHNQSALAASGESNAQECRKIRRKLNALKARAGISATTAATFYNENMDSQEALASLEVHKEKLTSINEQWLRHMETLTDISDEDLNQEFLVEAAKVENDLTEGLAYLQSLRRFLMNEVSGTSTESTFDSTRRDATVHTPQSVLNGPSPVLQTSRNEDWRSSTGNPVEPPPEIPLGLGDSIQRPSLERARTQDQSGALPTRRAPQAPTFNSPNPTPLPTQQGQAFNSLTPGEPQSSGPRDWRIPMSMPETPAQPELPKAEVSTTAEDPSNYMPKLSKNFKMPRFSGDVKEFRRFMNTFNAFVHNRQIPELQKVILLSGALSGRAFQCVKHLDIAAESYETMRQLLEDEFGDEDLAEVGHLRALDGILSSGGDIKYDKLPSFVNSISQHILALIALGESYSTLSPSYAERILAKLSRDLQREFLKVFRDKNRQTHTCKLEALHSFLREEARTAGALTASRDSSSRQSPSGNQRFGKFQSDQQSNKPRTFSQSGNQQRPSQQRQGFKPQQNSYRNTTNNFHLASQPTQFQHRDTPPEPKRKLKISCIFCEGDHQPFRCPASLTPQERKDRAVAAKACLKCLKLNHEAKSCKEAFKKTCRFCKGKHYSIICSKAPVDMFEKKSRTSIVNLKTEINDQPVYLWTAHVWAEVKGKRVLCRILVDPGSQSSHVTHTMANKLGSAPESHIDLAMSTAGGRVTNIHNCGVHNITLRSRFDVDKSVQIKAIELKCLSRAKFPILKENFGLSPIADQGSENELELVDILIGTENLAKIEFSEPRTFKDMFAFHSIFGWIFGGTNGSAPNPTTTTRFCGFEIIQVATQSASHSEVEPLASREENRAASPPSERKAQTLEDIRFLWLSEEVGFDDESSETKEEEDELNKALVENFRKTTRRDETGRYVLRLQLKDNVLSLGDNHNLSLSRLFSLLDKLKRDPVKLKAVDAEMKKYFDDGFIEYAKPKLDNQLAHYLPVQAVFKANPSAPLQLKTRVVKDASARRSNEAGLNDVLHQGPCLLPSILKVVMKFREYRYTLTADIEKAFNQFKIAEDDRTFLRFLWPLGISDNPNASIREFWTNRLDFGLICSPFLHCQGVRLHLENAIRQYPGQEKFIKEISDTIYMDDICFGADSIQEAKRRIKLLFNIFQDGHFPLKKWSANDKSLGDFIKQISPVPDTVITARQQDGKFLGIPWNQLSDELAVPTAKALKELTTGTPSKRKLLRGLAQVYDPLNILAPSTIKAKILLQNLWKSKCSWDAELNAGQKEQYSEFIELLERTKTFSVGRNLRSAVAGVVDRQLHIFCDASLAAYGCVAYIRETAPNSRPRVYFVMAKAKVAPVKPMSICRLELLGSALAARLLDTLKRSLDIEIQSYHMYTDNSSVLTWVNSEPEKWKAYVANRIRRIQALTKGASWNFVKSEFNSADILSRGIDISVPEKRKLWLHGPPWLSTESRPDSEKHPLECRAKEFEAERKATVSTCMNIATFPSEIFFENRFSSFLKAVRFWAFMIRLKNKIQAIKSGTGIGPCEQQPSMRIDAEEMAAARLDLLRLIQRTYFAEEVKSRCENLKKSSILYQYSPFIDAEGLLRCRSRLERSKDLTTNQKFPIILPSNSNLTKLVIKDVHERRNFHCGGIAATLHILRQDFLVIHARKLTMQLLAACPTCKIFHCKPASLPMAPLPSFRIEEAPPFFHTGCDFAGPFRYKKDNGEISKCYFLLFVCAVTRAVHIELTTDLSTAEVLGALLEKHQIVACALGCGGC